jgi:uncharacterized protein involved in type VI secretion and phage assembly
LPSKTHLQPGQTLLVGLVTNNKDPKGWGRVKVKFPTLTMDHESYWARVVGLGAANGRGFYCLPEINDEVLVGFEHGDIHRPYIVGGVWNGKDKTVEKVDKTIKDGKVRLRTIKTRTGHKIQFVEEDHLMSKAGVYINTKRRHRIDLNDSKKFIRIKTRGRHSIEMNDTIYSKKIVIETAGGHSIEMNDTPFSKQIAIETANGQQITLDDRKEEITIETLGVVNINAMADINLVAPAITMEGAVNIVGALTVEGAVNMVGALTVEGAVGIAGAPPVVDGVPMIVP